jgi:sugar phosphate permease
MSKKATGFHYGWVVLFMGVFVVFGALGLARFGYSIVFPTMQKNLGMDNEQAGMLATVSLLGYLALSIIGGILASKYGSRLTAALGLGLAGIGMVLTGFSNGFISLIIFSGLTGIGSGAANVAIMGLMPSWFSKEKRGLAAGITVSGSSIALILTGISVPWIISTYGESAWRICWFAFGTITLVLSVCSYIVLRNNPSELGLNPVGEDQNSVITPKQPLKRLQWNKVYLSKKIWYLGIVYIAFGFSYIIYMTFFVKYLESDLGYTKQAAGQLFMMMGWFSLICGLLWGMVSDRIGRKNALVILFLLHTTAFALFATGSVLYITFSVIIFGLSAWSIPAIMAATCGDLMGPKLASAGLGFITLFFGIGQAAGPIAAGAIADARGSFYMVFILASVVAFLGAVTSAFLIKNR